MEHIGIDLGSRESQVCVRNGVGELVEEKRCRTDQLGRYLGKRAPGRVVLETCTEAFRIAGRARQQGHDVRVVAATLVRSLGVGQRAADSRAPVRRRCYGRSDKLPSLATFAGRMIPWSSGPNRSLNAAAPRWPSWRSHANSRRCSMRCGNTRRPTIRHGELAVPSRRSASPA